MNEAHRPEFIKIAIIESAVEAQVLESVLNERHIPHQIRSFHDTAFNGIFQVQKGWGSVLAPAANEREILEIIDDIRSGHQDM